MYVGGFKDGPTDPVGGVAVCHVERLQELLYEGIRVEFDSIEDRQRYLAHHAHMAFASNVVVPSL